MKKRLEARVKFLTEKIEMYEAALAAQPKGTAACGLFRRLINDNKAERDALQVRIDLYPKDRD